MVVRSADDVDQLEGASPSGLPAPAVAVAVVVLAAAAVAVVVAHGAGHPRATTARPTAARPTPAAASPPAGDTGAAASAPDRGSVFLEHLGACTRTDLRTRLTVALGVTNLGARPLRLLGAVPISAVAGLRLTRVQIGRGPCAAGGGSRPVTLPPAAGAVVSLSFSLGPACPRDSPLAARVSFDASGRLVQGESSQLLDLSRLRFAECGGT